MKQTARTDACPILRPNKLEVTAIRSAWSVFEEMAWKGRRGACIGDETHAYSATSLDDLSKFVAGILQACDSGNATPMAAVSSEPEAIEGNGKEEP